MPFPTFHLRQSTRSEKRKRFSASLEDCMFDLRKNESVAGGVAGVKLIFAEAPDMHVVGAQL